MHIETLNIIIPGRMTGDIALSEILPNYSLSKNFGWIK